MNNLTSPFLFLFQRMKSNLPSGDLIGDNIGVDEIELSAGVA